MRWVLNKCVQARADRGSFRSVETRTEFVARPRLRCTPAAIDLHNDPRGTGPTPQRCRPRAEAARLVERELHGFRSSSRALFVRGLDSSLVCSERVFLRRIDTGDAVQSCKELFPGVAVFLQ